MYAPVIVGSCGNQSGHFKSYIFLVFVDWHGQVAGDSMIHNRRSSIVSQLPLKALEHKIYLSSQLNKKLESLHVVPACIWVLEIKHNDTTLWQSSRVVTVVRALAFHQGALGAIPGLGVVSGLSLLVVFSALRDFFPRYSGFPIKNQQLIRFDLR